MIKIEKFDEVYIRIFADRSIDQELSDFFTYMMPGAKYTPKYKAKMWDGKIRLFSTQTKKLYSGLIQYVIEFARRNGYDVNIDPDIIYNNKITLDDVEGFAKVLKLCSKGNPLQIRDYQLEAIHRALNENKALLISPTACLDPETIIEIDHEGLKSVTLAELEQIIKQGNTPLISTPTGYESITDTYRKIGPGVEITFSDNSIIKAANNHLMWNNGWIESKDLTVGEQFLDRSIINIDKIPPQSWIDFSLNAKHESYYHNNILHHNSGKSLIIYTIVRWHIANNRRCLILCPTTSLVVQLYADFEDYSSGNGWSVENNCQKLYSGFSKEFTTNCMISTWQSINPILKKGSTGTLKGSIDTPANDWMKAFDVAIVDECLHPDSLIQTMEKKTPIKNIKVNDLVLTLNEHTMEFEYKHVVKIHKNLSINEKKFKVNFDDGTYIIITGNHKMFSESGWKRTDELSKGERVFCCQN